MADEVKQWILELRFLYSEVNAEGVNGAGLTLTGEGCKAHIIQMDATKMTMDQLKDVFKEMPQVKLVVIDLPEVG